MTGRPVRIFPRCRGRALAAFVVVATACAGCSSTPVPGTSGLTQGGQQCEVCRLRNPGDNQACFSVCLPRIEELPPGTAAPHP